uniref:Neur_chan_LBD domain-containing protein n=1 Tax=Panagrellus redivivus TaxID=6233 RepID=A0A7E4UUE5_PANRE
MALVFSRFHVSPTQLVMLLLAILTVLPLAIASNSVPIPIEMDEMLHAGRHVYDKQSTPTQKLGTPTMVNLSMYIEGLSSFRTQTMDFQLDVYLQQFWIDERLKHNESKRILVRDKTILNRIWHPDIYFANARIAEFHEVTQPNFLLWMEPDGSILYDTRVSMIVMCSMNLAKWPLDSQQCHLRILSYAYDINQLRIAWNLDEPITRNMDITMSDMEIKKLVPGECDGNYSTGVWSCVTAGFFVQREITHHIMQSYVPTSLIVVISWFSFWLDVEAVPARVSLAITTLLTLSTQASTARMALPEVSYAKAIDVWSSTCMLFVFGVMIEFTVCNYVQRQALNHDRKDNGGVKRKKSHLSVGEYESGGTPFHTRAKSFMNRAMGRGGDQKQLVESNIDDPSKPLRPSSPRSRRSSNSLEQGGIDNEALTPDGTQGLRTSTLRKLARGGLASENGSRLAVPGAVLVADRQRGGERLANWAKASVDNSVNEPLLAPTSGGSSGIGNVGGAETNGKPKLLKVAGIGEKWTTALKQMQRNKKMLARHEAKKIDQFSRWSFPLAFGLFNLSYWTYYLYLT